MRMLRPPDRDDHGFSLVELLVTSTVMLIIFGMVLVAVSMIQTTSTAVSAQFDEVDQVLPALAPLHALLSAEVEPAPPSGCASPGGLSPSAGCQPVPGFAAAGNFSVTFFANVGTAYGNWTPCSTCAGGRQTAGPAKVQALLLDAAGSPAGPSTSCATRTPCSFQVRMWLPTQTTTPTGSSCPGLSTATPAPSACQYPATYRIVTTVQHVVNSPASTSGGVPTQPIFRYTLLDPNPGDSRASTLTSAQVQSGSVAAGAFGTGYPSTTTGLGTCSAWPAAAARSATDGSWASAFPACPLDAVQSVTVDLLVDIPGSGRNGSVENQLVAYRYAQSPGADSAPFVYSAAVG